MHTHSPVRRPDSIVRCLLCVRAPCVQNRNEDLATGKEIRVSPYRLAAHLATAFATFSLLVHTGLQVKVKIETRKVKTANVPTDAHPCTRKRGASRLRVLSRLGM